MDAPRYSLKPIYSLMSLSKTLGESVSFLQSLAKRRSNLYRYVPQIKKDGSARHTYDAYLPLKQVQRRIVDRILAKVIFPSYLHGGIRDVIKRRSIYSNASLHGMAKHLVLQDIKDFYPSISIAHVRVIFEKLFNFSPEVSQLLAELTTYNETVPQGASSSSYLANLVFWDLEPALVVRFRAMNLSYSRFADDITISSLQPISNAQITQIVSMVTNMLAQKGCYQKRTKLHIRKRGQTVQENNQFGPLTVTGLTVFNSAPGIPKKERKAIRAAVKQLEDKACSGEALEVLEPMMRKIMGRVGRLIACDHPDGEKFKQRIQAIRS